MQCPVFIQYGRDDSLISPQGVRKTAALMPDAEIEELPIGHFDIYKGSEFESAVTKQGDSLARHLGVQQCS